MAHQTSSTSCRVASWIVAVLERLQAMCWFMMYSYQFVYQHMDTEGEFLEIKAGWNSVHLLSHHIINEDIFSHVITNCFTHLQEWEVGHGDAIVGFCQCSPGHQPLYIYIVHIEYTCMFIHIISQILFRWCWVGSLTRKVADVSLKGTKGDVKVTKSNNKTTFWNPIN